MLRSLFITVLLLFGGLYASGQCTAVITYYQTYICDGQSELVVATPGGNIYQWYIDGTPIGTNNDSLSIPAMTTGYYTITADVTFGTCTSTTPPVPITVQALPVAVANNNNPCIGGTLQLFSSTNCMG